MSGCSSALEPVEGDDDGEGGDAGEGGDGLPTVDAHRFASELASELAGLVGSSVGLREGTGHAQGSDDEFSEDELSEDEMDAEVENDAWCGRATAPASAVEVEVQLGFDTSAPQVVACSLDTLPEALPAQRGAAAGAAAGDGRSGVSGATGASGERSDLPIGP